MIKVLGVEWVKPFKYHMQVGMGHVNEICERQLAIASCMILFDDASVVCDERDYL